MRASRAGLGNLGPCTPLVCSTPSEHTVNMLTEVTRCTYACNGLFYYDSSTEKCCLQRWISRSHLLLLYDAVCCNTVWGVTMMAQHVSVAAFACYHNQHSTFKSAVTESNIKQYRLNNRNSLTWCKMPQSAISNSFYFTLTSNFDLLSLKFDDMFMSVP